MRLQLPQCVQCCMKRSKNGILEMEDRFSNKLQQAVGNMKGEGKVEKEARQQLEERIALLGTNSALKQGHTSQNSNYEFEDFFFLTPFCRDRVSGSCFTRQLPGIGTGFILASLQMKMLTKQCLSSDGLWTKQWRQWKHWWGRWCEASKATKRWKLWTSTPLLPWQRLIRRCTL